MKIRLKTVLVFIALLAVILSVFVWLISLPKNVVKLRDAISKVELGCTRSELLNELGDFGRPDKSTVNEQDPSFLYDRWCLDWNYRLVVFYDQNDRTSTYQTAIILDNFGDIVPARGKYTNGILKFFRTEK